MATPVIGFNQVELSLYGSGFAGAPPTSDIARVVSGITDIGATWVRILMDWKLISGAYPTLDWSYLDTALTTITNAGLNVLLVPNDTPPFPVPTSPQAFAAFMTAAAQRYGPGGSVTLAVPVRHWEIWNEPNFFFGQPPNGGTIVSMYAYQKAGYDAIKAVDSGAFVISAGLIPVPNGWATTDAVTWLTGMYAAAPAGGPYPWDGVGFHPYSGTDAAGTQEPTTTQVWIAEIPQLYQVMVKYGDGAKPMWFTEFGFATLPSGVGGGLFVTPAVQAQWMVEEITNLQIVADQAGITTGPYFLYNYRNSLSDNGTASNQYGMGVVNFDFTPKPSWAAVRSLISGGAPVGVTSGGTVINLALTVTAAGTGPSGVTVGGTVIPLTLTVTASGTTTPNVATANWGALGIELKPVNVSSNTFQGISDELTGVANSSLEQFAAALKAIADAANSSAQTANNAAGNFVTLINGLVGAGEAEIEALLASLSGTASTSTVNTNQIAAIWAHVSAANTAGIHYNFDSTVPLTDNYSGTSNPSWAATGPLSLPTVLSGQTGASSTSGAQGMVFTGNPNSAVSDHGLVTDRNQVYATLANALFNGGTNFPSSLIFQQAMIFLSGHYSGGNLGQNVALLFSNGGGYATLQMYTATGPDSGMTPVGTTYNLPSTPKVGDVIGLQHDGSNTYTPYFNNVPGPSWTDAGPALNHGAGWRESGMICFYDFGNAIGLRSFVALDYV